MRNLRLYNPEYYCEVTIRAQDGEFSFDLNDVALRELVYGYFAEAVKRYQVQIFAFHFMSNHYHGLYGFATPQQFVAFLAYLHGQLARLANLSRGREGTFWSPLRVRAVARDEASVARRIRYILSQAVNAQIAGHPGQFPGPSTIDAMLYGLPLVGRRVDQTRRCRDRARLVGGAKPDADYETLVEVPLAVPHCWSSLAPAELRRLYRGIAEDIAKAPSEDAQSQVPGECLIADVTENSAGGSPESLETPPPAKQPVPGLRAECGGRHRPGPVKPKVDHGTRKRKRIPLLLSSNPAQIQAYEAAYAQSVEQYRAAKRAYRGEAKVRGGALHVASLVLPAWMLLGTLPLRLWAER